MASEDRCRPTHVRFVTEKERRVWKGYVARILCQHGHSYTAIRSSSWAGSAWEAAIGEHQTTGRPLWECL